MRERKKILTWNYAVEAVVVADIIIIVIVINLSVIAVAAAMSFTSL